MAKRAHKIWVRNYFTRHPEHIDGNAEQITFSIMLGLPYEECEGMYPECEWDQSMYDEYDGILAEVERFTR